MSTMVEQMEALKAEIETLNPQAEAVTAMKTELESVKVALAAAIAAKDEADKQAVKAKADADVTVIEAQKQLADMTAAKQSVDAELATAKVRLQNPAFKDASASGLAGGTADGGEPSDGASLWAQYAAIKDGKERTRFYRTNKEAMDAEAGR